jgi:CMP-N,N'-diacetyllegionaminic acid synthase
MEILAIILARGGSKGIPKKNIIDFAGKPLIAWTIEQAKASTLISNVFVSSDSDEILLISKTYGANTISRPMQISGDAATSESALIHFLDNLPKDPDLVVFLQPTSPLRKHDDIDNAINQLISDKADSLLTLIETQEFMWDESNGKFSPLTYDLNNRKGHNNLRKLYYENGSIYIFKPQILRKYMNRIGGKRSIYFMESWQRADIDNYSDYDLCLLNFNRYFVNDIENEER